MGDLQDDTVAATVAGLRELADFIEANPQFRPAAHERFHHYVDDADEFVALASQLGGRRHKEADATYYGMSRFFGGVELYLYTQREQVCEAKVVGKEKVMVRDPDAAMVEVERDVIEWECKPVLASGSTNALMAAS